LLRMMICEELGPSGDAGNPNLCDLSLLIALIAD
jgi:hypothetical protein